MALQRSGDNVAFFARSSEERDTPRSPFKSRGSALCHRQAEISLRAFLKRTSHSRSLNPHILTHE